MTNTPGGRRHRWPRRRRKDWPARRAPGARTDGGQTTVARYDELRMRDLLGPGADDLPAEEQPEPGPLSQQEALELLALSEVIARKAGYGRQLTVRSARAAGASWTQIGAALGTTKQSAWEAHSRWIDQQASHRSAYGHQSMDSQQAAAARALAGNPDNEESA
jgi:hypothetical protein